MAYGLSVRTKSGAILKIDGYPARPVCKCGPFTSAGVHFTPGTFTGEGVLKNIQSFDYPTGEWEGDYVIDSWVEVEGGINCTVSGPTYDSPIRVADIYEVDI